MNHLDELEAEAIYILREVAAECEKPVMLYSIGKDSSVMLHLAMKAFYPEKPPFPFLHVNTTWKFREMIEFRDRRAEELGIEMLEYINEEGVRQGINPFEHGASYTDIMKTQALKQALGKYGFTAAFGGGRRDEEKSRAKERIFSFRNREQAWDPKNQRPEMWKLFNTRIAQGESIRVFPLSNWTEKDIWQYIRRENIPIVSLYFAKERPVVERDGQLIMVDDERMKLLPGEKIEMKKVRFRTLGRYPLTGGMESDAETLDEIIGETLAAVESERTSRIIDSDGGSASMEKKEAGGIFLTMREDLLKFITCGSVDDGKSTLIGHMLYDAKLLFADQQKALELDSKVGSRDGDIDYSLLLDGLMAEREQGITIDVAYRYFTTDNRSFIVADTPGHEEYTRNMAVGASFASLAVILVDASQGVLIQTKRHSRICSLMGIRHFVFAVNKMDLVCHDKRKFRKIERDIKVLMAEFEYQSLKIIPVSATEGDNITKPSENMPWYTGEPLLTYLENVDVGEKEGKTGFSMPVQRVCRPNHSFRGFQGQISTGEIAVGDTITVMPSRETAKVAEILEGDKRVEQSSKGHAVTIRLDTEIDVSRGCVLERGYQLCTGSMFTASILWMDDSSLVAGRNFWLKLGTQQVPATVMKVKYKVDVNSGAEVYADRIYKNEIAYCEISVGSTIVFDRFENNRELGAVILIDRITNATSACGIVQEPLARGKSLTWHNMDITRNLRESQLGQKAITIWMTGLSGAGKSSLANALEKRLFSMGRHTMLLDGDNVRMGLNKNLGFEENDRIENIRRIAEVAKLMNDAGLIVLTSFISPFRQDRRNARDIIGESFVEVYVSTPLEECEKRDVKGLYKEARKGNLQHFTGISSPYEAPENPAVVIDTSKHSLEECVDILLEGLEEHLKSE